MHKSGFSFMHIIFILYILAVIAGNKFCIFSIFTFVKSVKKPAVFANTYFTRSKNSFQKIWKNNRKILPLLRKILRTAKST